MSTMGFLGVRRPAVQPVVDVRNAEAFDRMGLLGRAFLYVLAQERYAYMKAQHRQWKALGLDRVPAGREPFNPMLASHWLRRR